MKTIHLFVGEIACGKSYIAKDYAKYLLRSGCDSTYIEVSDIMTDVARARFNIDKPTREQLQAIKDQLKAEPRFLLDRILELIEKSPHNHILLVGLRELWIFKELKSLYTFGTIMIVEAQASARAKRRNYTELEMQQATERDNKIGNKDLLDYLASNEQHRVINNDYEQRLQHGSQG